MIVRADVSLTSVSPIPCSSYRGAKTTRWTKWFSVCSSDWWQRTHAWTWGIFERRESGHKQRFHCHHGGRSRPWEGAHLASRGHKLAGSRWSRGCRCSVHRPICSGGGLAFQTVRTSPKAHLWKMCYNTKIRYHLPSATDIAESKPPPLALSASEASEPCLMSLLWSPIYLTVFVLCSSLFGNSIAFSFFRFCMLPNSSLCGILLGIWKFSSFSSSSGTSWTMLGCAFESIASGFGVFSADEADPTYEAAFFYWIVSFLASE